MHYCSQWETLAPNVDKYVHSWTPSGESGQRGEQPELDSGLVVGIIHGLGEHGGRYMRLATSLANAGITAVAFDQQGHGRSPENRGCIASYDSLLDDIQLFLGWMRQAYPSRPLFLFGHSMGGNLVLNYALRRDVLPMGVIASSPMIRAAHPPSWVFERFARMLLRVAPNFCLRSKVDPRRLMDDPEEQDEFEADPLFHSSLSLRLGAALLDSGRWALDHAEQLTVPTLLTHGDKDYRTSHTASEEFARRAGDGLDLRLLPGHLHDPFRDSGRDEVIGTYVSFMRDLAARVAKA